MEEDIIGSKNGRFMYYLKLFDYKIYYQLIV
jgi:hypothetical protein